MEINKPELIDEGVNCKIQVQFKSNGISNILWYKFPIEYKKYLSLENLDAFVVALLVLAMKNDEDIKVNGKISAILNHNLNSYLIPALNLSNPELKRVNIVPFGTYCESINENKKNGTGVSCGIDSLATISKYLNTKPPFELDFLTFIDAGSHGIFGGELKNEIYNKRLKNVTLFASKIKLPIIKIESNIAELLNNKFQPYHSIINGSCVLNLQKLFKHYYYSAAYRFDYFKIDRKDTSSWDNLILNFISTESIKFFSSCSDMTRMEKTLLVSNLFNSHFHLDVCTNSLESSYLNCSKCEKCMRTILSLELLGFKESYKGVFDLKTFKKNRDFYIANLLKEKTSNQINLELFNLLKEHKQIKIKHYLLSQYFKTKELLKGSFN